MTLISPYHIILSYSLTTYQSVEDFSVFVLDFLTVNEKNSPREDDDVADIIFTVSCTRLQDEL